MARPNFEQYAHSLVHDAISRRDYSKLRHILAMLPSLPKAGDVTTEEESAVAEEKADRVSAAIDRRDVPGRETPLHLAVRLGDAIAVDMLMAAGADWSLQNEQGWSALQEAVCAREEGIAMTITRHYQTKAWAKWCRRLPRITGAMGRMRDFYMEITFNFESSVIPFVGKIAPSDTYRIWKQGSNLRADMTLAGFDGFKIQRANQSFLFLGEGTGDGKASPGSLLVLTHKDKEVTNALEGAGVQPSEAEIAQEVAIMSETNMYRPGIDVTQAELVPQIGWRRQEKTEMVGPWKAKIFDMHHVLVSIRSRRVPGAMTDEELFAVEVEEQGNHGDDDYVDILTEEEKQQLEDALSMRTSDASPRVCEIGDHVTSLDQVAVLEGTSDNVVEPMPVQNQKRTWFRRGKKIEKQDESNGEALSVGSCCECGGNGDVDKFGASSSLIVTKNNGMKRNVRNRRSSLGRKTTDENIDEEAVQSKKKAANDIKDPSSNHKQSSSSNGNHESEYKKGLRPILWLTPDFPLKTEELLPLLDILADKVKAVRRLRELLTTKLPLGTFPVKVAIPIVPTIRVVVTFNKFEALSTAEEFCTPSSSPAHSPDEKGEEKSSWLSWLRGSQAHNGGVNSVQEEEDPFVIPNDYTWIDVKEKKRRLKATKAKSRKCKKASPKSLEGEI